MPKSDDIRYMRSGMPWTTKELAMVAESELSDAELAKKLHRTELAISAKRQKLLRSKNGAKLTRWTPEEIELAYNAKYGEDPVIAKQLGRTVEAVRISRRKERIRRGEHTFRKPWSTKEIDILRSDLSNVEIAAQLNRTLKSVQSMRNRLNIGDPANRLHKPYTQEEISDILDSTYGITKELATKYGRTVKAITEFRYRYRKEMRDRT